MACRHGKPNPPNPTREGLSMLELGLHETYGRQKTKGLESQGLWVTTGDIFTTLDTAGLYLGGEGGIRTHGRLAPTPDFESGTFDHSATSPVRFDTAWHFSKTAIVAESGVPSKSLQHFRQSVASIRPYKATTPLARSRCHQRADSSPALLPAYDPLPDRSRSAYAAAPACPAHS